MRSWLSGACFGACIDFCHDRFRVRFYISGVCEVCGKSPKVPFSPYLRPDRCANDQAGYRSLRINK